MDISHGIPFASPMKIYAGDYDDVADAAIVVISACTKLERCFEAPDDHCFHQIIIACKRRFIIYNLCKKICDIFTRFPIKNLFLSWDNLP